MSRNWSNILRLYNAPQSIVHARLRFLFVFLIKKSKDRWFQTFSASLVELKRDKNVCHVCYPINSFRSSLKSIQSQKTLESITSKCWYSWKYFFNKTKCGFLVAKRIFGFIKKWKPLSSECIWIYWIISFCNTDLRGKRLN